MIEHCFEDIHGWFGIYGQEVYRMAVQSAPDNGVFVEVGCYKGRSCVFLAVELANSGKVYEHHCVDHWQGSDDFPPEEREAVPLSYEDFKRNMAGFPHKVHKMASVDAAATFADRSVDFVMIDASHDETSVTQDIAAWWPKVKPGGVMAGDDYQWPGVMAAANAAFGERLQTTGAYVWWIRKGEDE